MVFTDERICFAEQTEGGLNGIVFPNRESLLQVVAVSQNSTLSQCLSVTPGFPYDDLEPLYRAGRCRGPLESLEELHGYFFNALSTLALTGDENLEVQCSGGRVADFVSVSSIGIRVSRRVTLSCWERWTNGQNPRMRWDERSAHRQQPLFNG
jgi:hypothetical protein